MFCNYHGRLIQNYSTLVLKLKHYLRHLDSTKLCWTEENKAALITGGGAYNLFLIERIKTLSNSEINIPNSEIIEFKEALIFGFLGVLKNENKINCLKSVTGASKNHSSGKILYPKNSR